MIDATNKVFAKQFNHSVETNNAVYFPLTGTVWPSAVVAAM